MRPDWSGCRPCRGLSPVCSDGLLVRVPYGSMSSKDDGQRQTSRHGAFPVNGRAPGRCQRRSVTATSKRAILRPMLQYGLRLPAWRGLPFHSPNVHARATFSSTAACRGSTEAMRPAPESRFMLFWRAWHVPVMHHCVASQNGIPDRCPGARGVERFLCLEVVWVLDPPETGTMKVFNNVRVFDTLVSSLDFLSPPKPVLMMSSMVG